MSGTRRTSRVQVRILSSKFGVRRLVAALDHFPNQNFNSHPEVQSADKSAHSKTCGDHAREIPRKMRVSLAKPGILVAQGTEELKGRSKNLVVERITGRLMKASVRESDSL